MLLGAKQLTRNLNTLEAGIDKKVAGRAIDKTGKAAEVAAKNRVRVDTGRLKSSIKYGNQKLVALVDYAAAVEYGTSRVPAKPYMRPALTNVKRDIRHESERQLKYQVRRMKVTG